MRAREGTQPRRELAVIQQRSVTIAMSSEEAKEAAPAASAGGDDDEVPEMTEGYKVAAKVGLEEIVRRAAGGDPCRGV